jgi:hypothetical protein
MARTKMIRLPISTHIDVNFRNYAIYVLESRGIPAWEDALTNVQRIIVSNAKGSFDKTLTLIGDCFKDSYHHGDASLIKAIAKLAKPFGCSEPLLEGDGFFGTIVKNTPAAPRYTSVKLNPNFSTTLNERHFLNTRNDEGARNPLHTLVPVGLSTMAIGIAVGYKTTILPRNLNDVQKYFDGKLKQVKPYFIGFRGNITRYQNFDKTWLFDGVVDFDDKKHELVITDIPPLMNFDSFVKKLEKIVEDHNNKCTILNNSKSDVDIKIKYTGFNDDWEKFKVSIQKATKMLVTETPVFIKNGLVIQYNRIEDYLDDFKFRIAEINYKTCEYELDKISYELEYNDAKKLYLEFMLMPGKKTDSEIDIFLKKFTDKIASRLSNILLMKLSKEELQRTIEKIKLLKEDKNKKIKETKETKTIFENLSDISLTRGTKNKMVKDLLEDVESIDGIEFFNGEDIDIPEYDEKE